MLASKRGAQEYHNHMLKRATLPFRSFSKDHHQYFFFFFSEWKCSTGERSFLLVWASHSRKQWFSAMRKKNGADTAQVARTVSLRRWLTLARRPEGEQRLQMQQPEHVRQQGRVKATGENELNKRSWTTMEERDEVRGEGMNHIIPHKARSSGFILSTKKSTGAL